MSLEYVYVGSTGPYIGDPDQDDMWKGLYTSHTPDADNYVVRLVDLNERLYPIPVLPGTITNPDLTVGYRSYGKCLNNWRNVMHDSGFVVTKDSAEISVFDRSVLSVTSRNNLVDQQTPSIFKLYQNFPNPFNAETTICFGLPPNVDSYISVMIFNSHGQLIRVVYEGMATTGLYTVRWDGRTDAGDYVGSGVYFCRLRVRGTTLMTKMLYTR